MLTGTEALRALPEFSDELLLLVETAASVLSDEEDPDCEQAARVIHIIATNTIDNIFVKYDFFISHHLRVRNRYCYRGLSIKSNRVLFVKMLCRFCYFYERLHGFAYGILIRTI